MKTCNNCGTNNVLEAVKCAGCNMPGNFTHHGAHTEEITENDSHQVQCSNCGSFHPGVGLACQHCRFPLNKARVKAFSKTSLQLYRKVG